MPPTADLTTGQRTKGGGATREGVKPLRERRKLTGRKDQRELAGRRANKNEKRGLVGKGR